MSENTPTTEIATHKTDLTNLLTELDSNFKSWSPDQFIEFIKANEDLRVDCIPVDLNKNVIVPRGTKLADCAITMKSLGTLANTLGREGRYKGIGIDGSNTIKPYAVALRAVYKRVHIDLDMNVFGADGCCPDELLAWVAETQTAALKIRGNRQRMTLIFGIDAELQDYLCDRYAAKKDARGRLIGGISKRIYSLEEGKGKVEITIGANNNTIFGYHPNAGQYQQIAPDDNELGAITLEEYEQLIEILEAVSVSSLTKGGNKGSRLGVEDLWKETREIQELIDYNKSIDASYPIPHGDKGLRLNINAYLDSNTKAVLAGELVYDGSSYIDAYADLSDSSADYKYPIGEGVRHSTFRKVGSDIQQILAIFEACALDYSDDDIEEIFDDLWNLTDPSGCGLTGSQFTVVDARAAFHNNEYVTYSQKYGAILCCNIWRDILTIIEDKIKNYDDESETTDETIKTKLADTVKSGVEVLESSIGNDRKLSDKLKLPVDVNANDNPYIPLTEETAKKKKAKKKEPEVIPENESKADRFKRLASKTIIPKITDDEIDLEDFINDDDSEGATKALQEIEKKRRKYNADNESEESLIISADDASLDELEAIAQKQRELKELTTTDQLNIVSPILRESLQRVLGSKLKGYTFPFMVQTLAVFAAAHRELDVINLDGTDTRYKTKVAPFAITITGSGEGKSLVSNLVDPIGGFLNAAYRNLNDNAWLHFKKTYMQGTTLIDPDKLAKKLENEDGDDENIEENIEILRVLERLFINSKPSEFFNGSMARSVTDATEAALRHQYGLQQMSKNIERETHGKILRGSYRHPITIFNDEISSILRAIHNATKSGSSHFADAAMFCALKEGNRQDTLRQNTGYTTTDASVATMAGNITTKDFLELLKFELEGTQGLFPRFNFTTMEAMPVEHIDPDRVQNWNKGIEPKDLIAHYLVGAACVAHHISTALLKDGFVTNPLVVGEFRLSDDAQKSLYDAMNKAEKEKKRLHEQFPHHAGFIGSCIQKHPKEICLYAAEINIFENALAFYDQLISHIASGKDSTVEIKSLEELIEMTANKDSSMQKSFDIFIKKAMNAYGTRIEKSSYGFDRQVSQDSLLKGEAIYFRSIHTIEKYLYDIDQRDAGDLSKVAQDARNRSTIRTYDKSGYDAVDMFDNVAKGLIKLISANGEDCVFSESKVGTSTTFAVRKIYNTQKEALSRVFDALVKSKILVRVESNRSDSRKFKLDPEVRMHEISDRTRALSATLIKMI